MITGEEIALVTGVATAGKVGFDIFSRVWDVLTKGKRTRDLEKLKSAAWRELLKNDSGDLAVVRSALATAKAAGDTSAGAIRLEESFVRATTSKRKASKGGVAKKKAAKGSRSKPAARKPAVRKKARK